MVEIMTSNWKEEMKKEITEYYKGILPAEAVERSFEWWSKFTERLLKEVIDEIPNIVSPIPDDQPLAHTQGRNCAFREVKEQLTNKYL
jgi:hypothetical protein